MYNINKKLFLIIGLFISLASFSQTQKLAEDVPAGGGSFALSDTKYLRGGFMQATRTTERDSITLDRQKVGMLVYVSSVDSVYQLQSKSSSLTRGNWFGFKLGSGSDANKVSKSGDTMTGNLSLKGNRFLSIDRTGNSSGNLYSKGLNFIDSLNNNSNTTYRADAIINDTATVKLPISSGKIAITNDIVTYGKVLGFSGLNLQPVTNRLQMPNQNFFEGADTIVTYRTRFAVISPTGWVRVIYDNQTYNQIGIHPYTIEASLQAIPTDATNINSVGLRRLSFNGQNSAIVYPGKQVISDPIYIGLDPVNGAYIMMRNCVTAVGAVANKWPVGLTNRYPYEGSAVGNLVDTGNTFNYGGNGQQSFAPFMIGSIRVKQNSYILLGNSIVDGSGDLVPTRGFGGFLQDKYQIPVSKSAVPGETLTFFNSGNYYSYRYVYGDHANYVMSEYGTNDIGVGRTSVELRQDLLKFFHDTYRMGKLHIQTTLLPRATSTDNWQTATNQTPWTLDSIRITVNNWLRAGAPCYLSSDGYSATPAPIGSGVKCPWLYKTIDMASAIEVNSSNVLTVNGGRWLIGDTLTTGTASFGATYMLQDASKDFNSIKVSGALLVITAGTGAGQVVQIVGAASPTQINFVSSLSVAPDATSVYHILDIPTVDQVHPTNNFHEKIADKIYSELPTASIGKIKHLKRYSQAA